MVRGFTLIELLVVIGITSILTTISAMLFSDYSKDAKLTKIIAEEVQWQQELMAECTLKGLIDCDAGTSCQDILTNNPSAINNYYMIKAGPNSLPVGVYCDMENGGWTRIRALLSNESERQAWGAADPDIVAGTCIECRDLWPKNISAESTTLTSYARYRLGPDFTFTESNPGELSECVRGKTIWVGGHSSLPGQLQLRSEADSCREAYQDYIYYR